MLSGKPYLLNGKTSYYSGPTSTAPAGVNTYTSDLLAHGNLLLSNSQINSPVSQKPSEPAVLSSDGAQQKVDDTKAKLTAMSQKGTTVAADGTAVYSDGSAVAAPAQATFNEKSGQYEYNGKSYSVADFYGQNGAEVDPDYKAITDMFAPIKASTDANTLASINAIQQQFEALKAQQQVYNSKAEQARSRSLLLGGASRYEPLGAAGIMLSQTSYGLQKIQDLDAQENAAIAQAKAAGDANDMNLMMKAMDMAEGARKEKQTQAAAVMKTIQDANTKLTEQRQQLDKDENVAKLMSAGVTDPAAILKQMNDAGIPMTADEVKKAITNLTPAAKTGQLYKFSNTDVGKLLAAGMTGDMIQSAQDYYNGEGTPPQLTGAQQAALQKVLSGVTATGGGGGDFTSEEKRKLEQAGLISAPRKDQLDFLYGKNTPTDDFAAARQFFKDNPDASRDELSAGLREHTKLTDGDINTLLDEAGAVDDAGGVTGNEDQIAIALVKSEGFMGDTQAAKDYLDNNKSIPLNGKDVKLSARQIKAIKDAIDTAYPNGSRSFGESVLPWGK